MLQHASIALVETACNAVQGWPVCMCPPVAALAIRCRTCLLSVCRDCCIRRAQFPRSPLITNVGGCGGQSSVHAPPRTPEPDWIPRACVNLKPVESNLSLSFETAAPTTVLRDREPPKAVAHCIVTHTPTHNTSSIQTCPYRVASSGPPIHSCRER